MMPVVQHMERAIALRLSEANACTSSEARSRTDSVRAPGASSRSFAIASSPLRRSRQAWEKIGVLAGKFERRMMACRC